jgi:hypothetical protein
MTLHQAQHDAVAEAEHIMHLAHRRQLARLLKERGKIERELHGLSPAWRAK